MATQIVMPQLGESVAEGVIGKWLKQEGDSIAKDEPIVEVVTDKVNAEIPSPVAGVLQKISAAEGETVAVGQEIAVIGDQSDTAPPPEQSQNAGEVVQSGAGSQFSGGSPPAQESYRQEPSVASTAVQVAPQPVTSPGDASGFQQANGAEGNGAGRVVRSSPLVQRLAAEHNVDLTRVPGTGIGGRVSKKDILQYIQSPQPSASQMAPQPAPSAPTQPASFEPTPSPALQTAPVSPQPPPAVEQATVAPSPPPQHSAFSTVRTAICSGSLGLRVGCSAS